MHQFQQFIDKALQTAKTKGYLEDTHIKTQCVLIVSEFFEALDAHRHDRWSRVPDSALLHAQQGNFDYYHDKVEGTVEDELADVCIRAFTLAGYTEVRSFSELKPASTDVTLPFPIYVWDVIVSLTSTNDAPTLAAYAVYHAFRWCNYRSISLTKFIKVKQLYNKTREFKNGALY